MSLLGGFLGETLWARWKGHDILKVTEILEDNLKVEKKPLQLSDLLKKKKSRKEKQLRTMNVCRFLCFTLL